MVREMSVTGSETAKICMAPEAGWHITTQIFGEPQELWMALLGNLE
jgi:hypothetical protein